MPVTWGRLVKGGNEAGRGLLDRSGPSIGIRTGRTTSRDTDVTRWLHSNSNLESIIATSATQSKQGLTVVEIYDRTAGLPKTSFAIAIK